MYFTVFCVFSVVLAQNCDPGVCAGIPGLVYNAELDQCAWPDEVGCSLQGKLKSGVNNGDICICWT